MDGGMNGFRAGAPCPRKQLSVDLANIVGRERAALVNDGEDGEIEFGHFGGAYAGGVAGGKGLHIIRGVLCVARFFVAPARLRPSCSTSSSGSRVSFTWPSPAPISSFQSRP